MSELFPPEHVDESTLQREVSATRSQTAPSLGRVAVFLALLAFVLGGPSLFIASQQFDLFPVFIAVVFIYGVVLATTQAPLGQRLLRNRALTRSIGTVVAVRIITIPFSVILDVHFGMFAVKVTKAVSLQESMPTGHNAFVSVFLATVIQACLGLSAFAIFTFLLYPINYRHLQKNDCTGLCIQCGYDRRASRERCPECGLAVPAAHRATFVEGP